MIDRARPTLRPQGPAAGYQRWRDLLFVHFELPAAAVRPLVPAGLELDLLDGRLLVGLVPFAMEGVRPRFWPERLAFRFLETNVRTYVVHQGRPGVWFFSLDAESRIAVHAARLGWSLPYHHAAMRLARDGNVIHYETRRRTGAGLTARYRVGEPLGTSAPDSAEFFLLERYLLFTERRGRLAVGPVHHQPYPVRRAELLEVQDSLLTAARLPPPLGPPAYVHYAAGVDVEVFPLRPASS